MKKAVKRRKIKGGVLATIGYLLSPLSFWNDLFINFPIAYAMAIPFSLISQNFFLPAFVGAYWVTNVVGFILMHKGAQQIISKKGGKAHYTKKGLLQDIAISIIYTVIVIVLVLMGIIEPIQNYL